MDYRQHQNSKASVTCTPTFIMTITGDIKYYYLIG
jgi:hypothetical protein